MQRSATDRPVSWMPASAGMTKPRHFPSPPIGTRVSAMTKLEDIEAAITELSAEDLARLRAWFEEFDARLFDEKIERDAKAGKLDHLAAEALADHEAGRTRKL